MAARNAIAIDLGRRRLSAILASVNARRLRVRRVLTEMLPEELGSAGAEAVGAWAGRRLVQAGFPRGAATVAISREHVALKRLTLPTDDAGELPEMTRLSMRRELPFDADSAVIDFVVVERGEHSTTVLAVAIPRSVLDFTTKLAREAGFSVERVSLRNMGSAALVGSIGGGGPGEGILAVDVTGDRVEFSVVVDGVVRFSRAADLPPPQSAEELAEAVVTETRRTWTSYRAVAGSTDVRRAVVIGDRRVGGLAAGAIGEILKVPAEVLDDHPLIEPGGQDMDGAWPLAGLLLERARRGRTIDFVNPRRPPDTAGRRRRKVLVAAGIAVVLAGTGVTAARFHLAGLRDTLEGLKASARALRPDFERCDRDRARLAHLERWEEPDSDWLEHLSAIARFSPAPDRLVLDAWTGTLACGDVEYDPRTKRFSIGGEIRIVIEGEAADRETADRLRGALVETEVYRIATAGPDAAGGKRLPFGFRYQVTCAAARSKPVAPPQEARR